MFRARFVVAILSLLALTAIASAQSEPSTASCNLDDGRQVYIRYNPVSGKSEKPPNGKPWTPGGTPMTLFTEAQLIRQCQPSPSAPTPSIPSQRRHGLSSSTRT